MRVRIDRRALLISAASAVTGAGVGAAQTEQAPKVSLPSLDGSLQFDESSRAAATDDFGHIVRNRPESVLLPGSERDVATAIRWAGERGRKVAARGQGHSVYGRAQARDGLVIDMRQLRQLHAIADDHVVVGAGATWRELLEATLPRKLTPPVLTGYLDLSVAGTLVVGGVGDTTFRNGVQSDNVLELDVITGTGQKITCSLDNHTDLFEAMRAGLGQAGVITRATLKLIPAPDAVRFYELTYSDLQSMLVDQRLLATGHRCQGLQGAIVSSPAGWSYKIDAVTYGAAGDATANDRSVLAGLAVDKAAVRVRTLTYLDYLDRLSALERLLRSKGQWLNPHPWLTTFVADFSCRTPCRRRTPPLAGRRPRPVRTGSSFTAPPLCHRQSAAAAARRRDALRLQSGAHAGHRQRRHRGHSPDCRQPRGLRANSGRRRGALPGQRLHHVGRGLAKSFRPRVDATAAGKDKIRSRSPAYTRLRDLLTRGTSA